MQKSGTEKIKLAFKAKKYLRLHWAKMIFVLIAAFALLMPYIFFAPSDGVTMKYGRHRYALEVASSSESRQKGLGGRTEMATNKGMLFVFDEPGRYCFWMKDTLIPLDLIWLDRDYRVVHTEENVQPETYPSEEFCYEGQAKYVIELNAGEVKKAGIKTGATLDMKY